jgi:tetratricopeptide (TPR) repeat protein/tRNA A-37 threonylcarbamoyl transferase component Bud32
VNLEDAIAEWLLRREQDPGLLPTTFAAELPAALRVGFLAEIEALAEIERVAMAPPRDLPRRFADFRVLGQLGQGASGVVYEAEQVSLERRVALKVLHPGFAADLRGAARFEREARTAASLQHPRIVPVHSFGEHEGFLYLVMGLAEGRSLQRLLAARRDPRDVDHAAARALLDDERRLLTALADVADTLDFAHRKNVVHRDVKPANLIVDAGGQICVLDFGIASTRGVGTSQLTHTGDLLGTPLYMAPEQAEGRRDVDARADVYSLGALLYECLTGATPFQSAPLALLLERIRSADPPPPRSLRAELRPELEHIVLKCLEKEPARRYARAADLADDLRRYLSGDAVHARPVGPVERAWRRVRRRPRTAAVIALLAAAAGSAAVWGTVSSAAAERFAVVQEVRAIERALAFAPEGITALGGASWRFYRSFGLLEPDATAATPSAEAKAIVERTRALQRRAPRDDRVRRLAAHVLFEVGESTDASALSWSPGFLLLARGENLAAIEAFDHTLQREDLDDEQRYAVFLHRGWCRTCPDVGDLRRAQDDLVAAMALRKDYVTPKLLWAALRLLDPDDSVVAPTVQAVGEALQATNHEPWVVLLATRVVLAFAEPGADLPGPVTFHRGLSPLAGLPLARARRDALAATALALVESVLQRAPDNLDALAQQAAAQTMLRRFDAAQQTAERIRRSRPALGALVRARVLLATGRADQALAAVGQALAEAPSSAAALVLRADICAHRGDVGGESEALGLAAEVLLAAEPVQPPSPPLVPELQVRLARSWLLAGQPARARAVLDDPRLLDPRHGGAAPRARAERAILTALVEERSGRAVELLRAAEQTLAECAPRETEPLRALFSVLAGIHARNGDPAQAQACEQRAAKALAGVWWRPLVLRERGWLELPPPRARDLLAGLQKSQPHERLLEALADTTRAAADLRAVAALAGCAASHDASLAAVLVPEDAAGASAALARALACERHDLRRIWREAPGLVALPRASELLAFAERAGALLGGDARLLQATVLLGLGRTVEAQATLQAHVQDDPLDLRARYLLAAACLQAGDEAAAGKALGPTTRGQLGYVERALGFAAAAPVAARLRGLARE